MSIVAYFEDIDSQIIRLLKSAKESVRICVAWINGGIYAGILEDLAKKGVQVQIVFNDDHTNNSYGIPKSVSYRRYPINTRLSSSLMHNKFCIIDDEVVVTGSFNWSIKARDSFENIVVVKDDFKLVKQFLHEFHDLIAYYDACSRGVINKCGCGSHVYNIGILGYEEGRYDESRVDVWSLCVKNNHAVHLGMQHEQFLHTYLGMKDDQCLDDYYYDDTCYDKALMLDDFCRERRQAQDLQNYFNDRHQVPVHAVGAVSMGNFNAHVKWNEMPEYVVNVLWRDMYYRKLIPEVLYDDIYGGIGAIIHHQVPSWC